nr:MAG TPA: Integrase [Caudoviricetes sp.]
MLIECPECGLQVSDKAMSCPHCGYPMKPEATRVRKPRSNKRKRLPNGFGQITELKGKALRKPFRAMVTVGKTPEGKPVCKLLKPQAYFETYNDAYQALMEYNKNPFDFSKDVTVKELYDRWSSEFYSTIANPKAYKSAWKYCSNVYNLPIRELKIHHIKFCMYESSVTDGYGTRGASVNVRNTIKTLFGKLLDYGIENELLEKNCARAFKFKDDLVTKKHHMDFSSEEIEKLWANLDTIPYSDLIIFQCYTGMRPSEIGNILVENMHLDEHYFIGGMKTENGKNRIIPIHHKIYNIVKKYYDDAVAINSKYVFNYIPEGTQNKCQLNYNGYRAIFQNAVSILGMNPEHKPHDGRLQFVTQAKKAKMDEYALKRIVGHRIDDITESIYTKRDIGWFIEEVEKIK